MTYLVFIKAMLTTEESVRTSANLTGRLVRTMGIPGHRSEELAHDLTSVHP